jgi:dTDP-D-glucose 4,6-dehydratase
MKLILAGSTGFIGAEVLRQCLANPSITSLVALSRRELPSTFADPDQKLKTVLVKDFEEYEATVIKECKGAAGCIWYVHTTFYLTTFGSKQQVQLPTPRLIEQTQGTRHRITRY